MYNVVCTGYQSSGFSYTFMVDSFILKVALLAITMYLVKQFRDRAFDLYGVNYWTFVNDEVKALIRERSKDHGIIVTDHNYDAISSVADNLFVISDGYTSPVRCREDLVRHGYLRAEDKTCPSAR